MFDLKPSGNPAPPGWMTFYCTNALSGLCSSSSAASWVAPEASPMQKSQAGSVLEVFAALSPHISGAVDEAAPHHRARGQRVGNSQP
jgi:hypothetical protein